MAKDNNKEIPYESPLSKIPYTQGLLDYLVPDQIEKQTLQALAREGEKQKSYGSFTPTVGNNPQGLSNLETLLGYAYMPQHFTKAPTNKQMINASILRAGLELGKGRLPGENFGVALNRGMEAFGAPGKTLADYKLAQRTANKSGALGEAGIIKEIKDDIKKGMLRVGPISGVEDISKEYPIFYNNLVTNAFNKYAQTGNYGAAQAYSTKIFDELYTNVEVKDGKLSFKDASIASPEMMDLITKANKAKVEEETTGSVSQPIIKRELK